MGLMVFFELDEAFYRVSHEYSMEALKSAGVRMKVRLCTFGIRNEQDTMRG